MKDLRAFDLGSTTLTRDILLLNPQLPLKNQGFADLRGSTVSKVAKARIFVAPSPSSKVCKIACFSGSPSNSPSKEVKSKDILLHDQAWNAEDRKKIMEVSTDSGRLNLHTVSRCNLQASASPAPQWRPHRAPRVQAWWFVSVRDSMLRALAFPGF